MARTVKNTADYFPHDAEARNSDTLRVMQVRFGNDGYAFWFKLLEKLTSTEGHCIDVSVPARWQVFLADTGVNELQGVEMLLLLVEMQAIDKDLWDSRLIWCQKLVDNIADVYKNRKREIPLKPLTTGGNAITTGGNAITTDDIPQSKVKYSKVNKNIYIVLFNHWNEQEGTIHHKAITNGMSKAIDAALLEHTLEELIVSITNYAFIVRESVYYFNYKWTFDEFLSRKNGNNIERFLDLETAKSNFGENDNGKQGKRARKLPTAYTDPEDL